MKAQRGSALIALISILVIIGGLAGIGIYSYITASNYANKEEGDIEKMYVQSQNVLGSYTLKVQEMAQVPSMYVDQLKDVMASVMTARMGADGSKALVQFFKEANIPFDSSMLNRLQQVIEAGRNEFQSSQGRWIDRLGDYNTERGTFWRGMWIKFAGYPKTDLSKYKPVLAGDTREAFRTGVQAPINLRGK